ncbi:alpha/beta fold hydrolase [Sphingobium aquiterrae]|uniref:alpha/beta fold hydrolase n=1 Tax=Sphingobium aquiterrae TaxID=2038656 RepID=UPI003AFB1DAD
MPRPTAPLPRQEWATKEADYIVKNFQFRSGESLAEVRLHYTTLGQPHRNAKGEIDNAVMVLHGTGGTGKQFLAPSFAGELYNPGQPLDITKYWIILPDNVGHGGSSKPSDGMHMRFPKYDYDDMVELQHILLTKGLGLKHLRLIMGTSMGCMHAFVWGEAYPDFAKALMPLACEPVQLAGLNRMWRQLMLDGIRNDPAWMGGEYKTQPLLGLRTASSLSIVAGSAPLAAQSAYPTRDEAIAAARRSVERDIASRDANDMIYHFESSRNYNPWPNLEKITAPMMWLNSADDFINPRNFPYPQQAIARMPNAKFRLIEESAITRGHGTHTSASFWKQDLIELLQRSGN